MTLYSYGVDSVLIKVFGQTVFIIYLLLTSCQGSEDNVKNRKLAEIPMDDPYAKRRELMVQQQIVHRSITDKKVINAMLAVKRHLFVPEKYSERAYTDQPLPIEEGQTISQPYIVAFMTEHLKIKRTDKLLEIGTGSG